MSYEDSQSIGVGRRSFFRRYAVCSHLARAASKELLPEACPLCSRGMIERKCGVCGERVAIGCHEKGNRQIGYKYTRTCSPACDQLAKTMSFTRKCAVCGCEMGVIEKTYNRRVRRSSQIVCSDGCLVILRRDLSAQSWFGQARYGHDDDACSPEHNRPDCTQYHECLGRAARVDRRDVCPATCDRYVARPIERASDRILMSSSAGWLTAHGDDGDISRIRAV